MLEMLAIAKLLDSVRSDGGVEQQYRSAFEEDLGRFVRQVQGSDGPAAGYH